MVTRVIIRCAGNSARSQLAEGLLRRRPGVAFRASSTGTQPRPEINLPAIAAIDEIDSAVRSQRPKRVAEFERQRFDYAIAVCGRVKESSSVFPGARARHWSFPDLAELESAQEQRLQAFRDARAGLEARLAGLIAEMTTGASTD